MNKPIKTVIYCICGILLVISGWKLIDIFTEYTKASAAYKDAAEAAVSELTQSEDGEISPPIEVDFTSLCTSGSDIIGWIYCENTKINYPVVQSEDNSYYVDRMPNGTYSKSGSIFMDFRCTADLSDRNTVIYGHNMKDGSMFTALKKYSKQSFYDEHPVIWLFTPEQTYMIELIAGYVTSTDSDSFEIFADDEGMREYLEYSVKKSAFESEVPIESVERVVTLATCSYEYDTARYVLVGSAVPYQSISVSESDM